jgi:hypothetical protein
VRERAWRRITPDFAPTFATAAAHIASDDVNPAKHPKTVLKLHNSLKPKKTTKIKFELQFANKSFKRERETHTHKTTISLTHTKGRNPN